MDKFEKRVFMIRQIILTIFVILLDLLVLLIISKFWLGYVVYITVGIAIFLNAIYIVYFVLNRYSDPQKKSPLHLLMSLFEDMIYAKPLYEENLLQKSLADDLSIDHHVDQELEKENDPYQPKHIISETPIYNKSIDTNNYSDRLSEYLANHGLSIHKNDVREIFASMAASRLIMIELKDHEVSKRFVELFSEFIGANYFYDEISDDLSSFDSLLSDRYHLSECILKSDMEKEKISMILLKEVDVHQIKHYFEMIINYALNPMLPSLLATHHTNLVNRFP